MYFSKILQSWCSKIYNVFSQYSIDSAIGLPLPCILTVTLGEWLKLLGLSFLICSVQSLSHALLFITPCNTSGFLAHHQHPVFAQTHVHRVSDAIQPSRPLSSLSNSAVNISQHQGLFQWVSSSHQVAKYWSFSFSISPSNEYSGLISFRKD